MGAKIRLYILIYYLFYSSPRGDFTIYFLNKSDKSQKWRSSSAGRPDRDVILAAAPRTIYYSGALEICFSQLFRQFSILNCNLSDSLKNLPSLFQKWFEYFHQNKS
jgi:hypothetical protein